MEERKGTKTVYTAVKSASRVSKREGKWANLPEIKKKTPSVFKEPVHPLLNSLVRKKNIEKNKKLALWRPYKGGAGGGGMGSDSSSSRRTSDRKTGDRRSQPKDGSRCSRVKNTIRRGVGIGAIGGAMSSSVSAGVRSSIFK